MKVFSGKDFLSQEVYLTSQALPWNRVKYMAEALLRARSMKRENELPKWISSKEFDSETNNWLDKNLDMKADLSVKYGPYQMTYNYNIFRLVLRTLYFSKNIDNLKKALSLALSIKNDWYGRYEISRFFYEIGEYNIAWQFLQEAMTLNPTHFTFHFFFYRNSKKC